MPALSLPPPSDREWTLEEQTSLQDLLEHAVKSAPDLHSISDADVAIIRQLLANPKAVNRYHRVAAYALEKNGEQLKYAAWILQVLQGFQQFRPIIIGGIETPDGLKPALMPILTRTINFNYHKIFHRFPNEDQREAVIGQVLVSLNESYFYDTELEAWLWRTTRNILLNEVRDQSQHLTVPLDAIPPHHTPIERRDLTKQYILHERIREGIRNVTNQRYRVILLLLYSYQLDNSELAAFFGISVSRATTWISRARKALRQTYTPPDDGDDEGFAADQDDSK